MQELQQALAKVKSLHQTVLGQPAPELGPTSYYPFPVGVDPLRHAVLEVEHLEQLSEWMALAPRPDAWTPLADSWATKDELVVRLDLAGVPRQDVKVLVVGNECVVRGERKPQEGVDAVRPMTMERPWGPFERRFAVPTWSRVDDIQARAVDGVLELRIPTERVQARKERKVEVV